MLAAGANPLVAACAPNTARNARKTKAPMASPARVAGPYGRLAMGGSSCRQRIAYPLDEFKRGGTGAPSKN